MKKRARIITFIIIVVLGLVFLYVKRSSLLQFNNISFPEAMILFLTSGLDFVLLGLAFRCLMKVFHVGLRFKEWFGLSVCNSMFNYYLPAKGGTAVKAYYLQKRHGLRYSVYVSSVAGSYLISLFVYSGLGTAALVAKYGLSSSAPRAMAWMLLLSASVSLAAVAAVRLLFALKIRIKAGKADELLSRFREGTAQFSRRKADVFRFTVFMALYTALAALRLFLCFSFLGVRVGYAETLMIRSLAQFAFLFSIIPGNLGLKEGFLVFAAGLFGIDSGQALLAALIDRMAAMVVTFGLGMVFSRILLGRLEKKRIPEESLDPDV